MFREFGVGTAGHEELRPIVFFAPLQVAKYIVTQHTNPRKRSIGKAVHTLSQHVLQAVLRQLAQGLHLRKGRYAVRRLDQADRRTWSRFDPGFGRGARVSEVAQRNTFVLGLKPNEQGIHVGIFGILDRGVF